MKFWFTVLLCLLLALINLGMKTGVEDESDDLTVIEGEMPLDYSLLDYLSPFIEDARFERSVTNTSTKNFTHFYEVSQPNDREWPHIQTMQFIDRTKDPRRYVIGTVTYIDSPRSTFSVLEPFKPGSCNSVWPVRSSVQTTSGRREGGCIVAQNAGFFRMSSSACLGNIISDGGFVRESDHVVNANFGIKASGKIFVGYLSNEEVKNQTDPFLQLVSGIIWLVKNGTNFVNESMHIESDNNEGTGNMSEFVNVISARTALGHDKLGRVMMLVVEGQTHKRGVNLFELADTMIEQGAVNAINLDGGGSATLLEEGILVNHVSDHCPGSPEYRCMRAVSTVLCAHDVSCVPQDCHQHGECVEGVCNCTSPWTGAGCSQLQCSNTSCGEHGACSEEGDKCECEDGWMGELCQHTCPNYFYGPNCQQMCWCSMYGFCAPSTGVCLCEPGYQGESCEDKCSEGRYGEDCVEECQCSENADCDHVLGCVCQDGWTGEQCNVSLIQNMTSPGTTHTVTALQANTTSTEPITTTELPQDDSGVTETSKTPTAPFPSSPLSTSTSTPNITSSIPISTSVPPHTTEDSVIDTSTKIEAINDTTDTPTNHNLFHFIGLDINTSCLQPLLLSYIPLLACSALSNILICFASWLYWGGKTGRKLKRRRDYSKARHQQLGMNTTAKKLKQKENSLLQKIMRSPVSYEPVSTQLGNESSDTSS